MVEMGVDDARAEGAWRWASRELAGGGAHMRIEDVRAAPLARSRCIPSTQVETRELARVGEACWTMAGASVDDGRADGGCRWMARVDLGMSQGT